MKKTIFLFLLFSCSFVFGQFKADVDKPLDIKSAITNKSNDNNAFTNQDNNSFLGIINPANLSMHHSFGLSYASMGSGFMTLGVYTNTLQYKFNDRLRFEMDASIVNSPANSFGKDFTQQLNGIYITKALLNYKLSDNAHISVEYRQMPMGFGYDPYGYSSYGMFGGYGGFGGFGGYSHFGFGHDNFWDE